MRLLTLLACAALLFAAGCEKAEEGAEDKSSANTNENGTGGGTGTATNMAGAVDFSQDNASISFVGSKPTGDEHAGRFETFSGWFKFDAENPTESAVNVTIDMNSVWTDAPGLTRHLKNQDFFEVVEYPEATFESTSFESTGGDMYNIVGNLTLHGVTKEVTLPAKVTVADGKLNVSITYPLKRSEFGISYGGDTINEEVPLTIAINADAA